MTRVYIGIGSNLSNPLTQVKQAVEHLKSIQGTELVCCSSLYGSKPMGPQDQPDYVNAVAELNTTLTPLALLDTLQAIELDSGREREKDNRWGARVLDLDILLFGDQEIDSPRLIIPHYGMKVREFVILPLQEIAPNLALPCGTTVKNIAENIDHNDLTILSGI